MDTSTGTPSAPARVTFGDVFNQTWDIFKAHYRTVIPLVLIVYIPIQILAAASRAGNNGWTLFLAIPLAILSIIGPMWAVTCITRLTERAMQSSDPITFKQSLWLGAGWYRVLAVSLIQGLIVLGIGAGGLLVGLLLSRFVPHGYMGLTIAVFALACFAYVFYLGIRWTFAAQVVVLANTSPWPSLKASSDLVAGQWWRVLGYSLLIGLIVGGVSLVFALPYGILTTLTIGRSVITEFLFSFITDILVAFAFVFKPVFYLLLRKEKGA